MEMVLACLRVLLHHGVIALVDMFFFTNRYESTDKAAALLAGKDPKMLQAAVEFAARRPFAGASMHPSEHSPSQHSLSPVMSPVNDECKSLDSKYYASFPPSAEGRDNALYLGGGAAATAANSIYRISSVNSHDAAATSFLHQSPAAVRRQLTRDEKEIELAIAELYCACHRNRSIGELWVDLFREQQLRRGGVSLSRTSLSSAAPLNWKKMFGLLEHRRLTSFGLVHGLIRRVHNFPMVVGGRFTESEMQSIASAMQDQSKKSSSQSDQHPHHPSSASLHLQRDRSLSSSRHGTHHPHGGLSHNIQQPKQTPGDEKKTALYLAYLMDGRHCDDELVCIFEKPLEDLFEMIKEERQVVSSYAP